MLLSLQLLWGLLILFTFKYLVFSLQRIKQSQAWLYTTVIPALKRLREKDGKFKEKRTTWDPVLKINRFINKAQQESSTRAYCTFKCSLNPSKALGLKINNKETNNHTNCRQSTMVQKQQYFLPQWTYDLNGTIEMLLEKPLEKQAAHIKHPIHVCVLVCQLKLLYFLMSTGITTPRKWKTINH